MKIDLVVAAYIFREDDKLLLIKHKKLDKWLPVGGHIESNETPDQAVIRESSEEVGLDVILLQYSKLEVGLKDLALPFGDLTSEIDFELRRLSECEGVVYSVFDSPKERYLSLTSS